MFTMRKSVRNDQNITVRVTFFVAIRRVDKVRGGVVSTTGFSVQTGRFAESVSGLAPLLGHFEKIARSLVTVDGIFDFVRSAVIKQSNVESTHVVDVSNRNCVSIKK